MWVLLDDICKFPHEIREVSGWVWVAVLIQSQLAVTGAPERQRPTVWPTGVLWLSTPNWEAEEVLCGVLKITQHYGQKKKEVIGQCSSLHSSSPIRLFLSHHKSFDSTKNKDVYCELKIRQTLACDIRKHWTAVLTLLGFISSLYWDIPHRRSNRRPQNAEPKLYY